MEILFAVAVIALLYFGLRSRKKQDEKWLKEERHDESGAWVDKRSGERGTFGSLDEEREKERLQLNVQGKVSDLARLTRTYFFEQHPDFETLSDEKIKQFIAFNKVQVASFVEKIEAVTSGARLETPGNPTGPETHRLALKKQILDFAFDNFPKLLDLELEAMRQFDCAAEFLASTLLNETERLKQ